MKKIIPFLMVFIALSGCKETPPGELLAEKYSTRAENGFPITLNFNKETSTISGRVVNNFRGTFKIEGNSISFGPVAATMMMGPMEGMKAEGEFFLFLEKVNALSIKGEQLTLKTENGAEMTFKKVSN